MNLKNVNHIQQLRRLGYPLNKMLIIGSGTMALLGLKKNDDIDIWATKDVHRRMANDKKLVRMVKHGDVIYETKDGNIEIGSNLPCTKGSLQAHLKRAIVVYGFHFKSVDDVLSWKKCMGRPKDKLHIKIIEKYKKNNVVENYLNILQTLRLEAEQKLTYEDEVDPLSIKDEFAPLWIDHIKFVNKIQNFPYKAPSRKMFEEKLMKSIRNSKKVVLFIVKDAEKIVGYIQTAISKNGKGGKIVSFHLLNDYRRTGVGSTLIKKGLKWLWKNGVREIELGTQGGNEAAVKFYKKHGFEIQGYNLRHKKSKY